MRKFFHGFCRERQRCAGNRRRGTTQMCRIVRGTCSFGVTECLSQYQGVQVQRHRRVRCRWYSLLVMMYQQQASSFERVRVERLSAPARTSLLVLISHPRFPSGRVAEDISEFRSNDDIPVLSWWTNQLHGEPSHVEQGEKHPGTKSFVSSRGRVKLYACLLEKGLGGRFGLFRSLLGTSSLIHIFV